MDVALLVSRPRASSRISSRAVPRVTDVSAWVCPRVKAQCRACGSDAGLDDDRADLGGPRPSGRRLVDGVPLADERLLELVEGALRALAELEVGPELGLSRVLGEQPAPRPSCRRPGARACPRPGWPGRALSPCECLDPRSSPGSTCGRSTSIFGLPYLLGELALGLAELLDLLVGDVERVEDLGLGDLVGAGLDHQDRLFGAGDDQVEIGVVDEVPLARVDDELPSTLPMRTAPTGGGERDVGRSISAALAPFMAKHVVGVDVVDRDRERNHVCVS